jgi:two-component system, chemotaxis family, CheB/CheR fusion protein
MKKKKTLPSQSENEKNENENVTENAEIHRPYIVGIGSSAGGLEALSTMVAALPCNLGIAYVVIQHLSPTHRSLMVQLLGRETALAVCEIEDNAIPEPDLIYVAPAGRNVVLQEGRFKLLETKREAMPKPSANAFFTSLAIEKGEDAIGVILSGTGSDGTVGLREIKANGGFTFAQEPSSAKYSGMPQSAIDSGCVDWILTPDKIAEEIANIVRHRPTIAIASEQLPHSHATLLKKLLMRVKQKTRIDFGGYKEATLWRRIERRMAANHFVRFEDYLQFVEQENDELERLSKDILISVTAFFRDPEAFERLKEVIHHIAQSKQQGDEIRMWVAACATGEEAYSIGILLAEELGENLPFFKIQIFATDIDNNAMNLARKGLYVEGALAEIPPALVSRYFAQRHDRYEISRTIRDMVVFARQDLVQDPPFLRLDLISCRNVLIYLQTDLQAKILATFHYGLRNGGFLFLGKSESIFQQETLFDVIDKQFRLFRRNTLEGKVPQTLFQMPLIIENASVNAHKKRDAEHYLFETAIKAYVPATILVNANLDIQHIYGDVSDYLTIPEGKPSTNLMHLLLRELRPDLQMLQHQAERKFQAVIGRPRTIRHGEKEKTIRLAVRPTENDITTSYFLISFEPVPESPIREIGSVESDSSRNVNELEDELTSTRERLQTVIEELETSNEEMQALNEEVQAANEELQSSNEELESSNEELQSTNEELTTVNEELQIRTTELAETFNDLERVQNCVGFPIIAVSENLKILRFNTPAASLFSMNRSSVGLYLTALRLPVGMNEFSAHVQEALMHDKVVEVALPTITRHYLLHISPYNDAKGDLRGAIITLVDDTERRANERAIHSSREKLLSIMNNSTAIITLKDIAGRYEFVNHQFEKVFNVKAADILGKTDVFFLSERISDNFRIKELEVIRTTQPSESEDHIQYDNIDLYLLSIRFPLLGEDKLPYGICTQMSDITSRVQAESQLRLAARVFDRSSEGIMVTDAQQNILTVNEAFTTITGYEAHEVIGQKPDILNSKHQPPQFYEEMWDAIKHAAGGKVKFGIGAKKVMCIPNG